ncbi:MAG: Sua5/YciO/YrdC/YwlC family protein [Bacteroidetes bacterium]|nr:Sua5/YciO/YrdC/YwlC family protein [Bacteroidota bacterium]
MSECVRVDVDNPAASVLKQAANVVRGGGLIVYPTETLYGIGADATNASAIRKIQEVKRRQENKAILVIVDSEEMLRELVDRISGPAKQLMERFWPGPLTLVFRASRLVPDELTQGRRTIGVRIPSSNLCLKLLVEAGVPLTSTSANVSGKAPERTVGRIQEQLSGIDLYLDAGELPESLPSTVVDVSFVVPRVLRQGAISFEQLRQVVPDIQLSTSSS